MRGWSGSRLLRPLALLILIALIPAPSPAPAAAADDGCLKLTGELKETNADMHLFEPVTFEYTIRPEGERIVTVRDPVEVAMVLDVSGSMNYPMLSNRTIPTRLETLKEASLSFLNELADLGAGDRVGLVKFATTASQVRGLTTDYAKVMQDVGKLSAGGSTNIDDGLRKGRQLLNNGTDRQKYVVLVTDGAATHYGTGGIANNGEAKRQALLRADELAASRIPVYTIALGQPGSADVDHDLLVSISQKTGGRKFDAANVDELKAVFRNIAKTIQQQGRITGIAIRQPLPPGFELADGAPPGARVENGVLIVPVADISYPFIVSGLKVAVPLKQTRQIGEFTFEDATLVYRDACDRDRSAPIRNHNTVRVLGWIDIWGNLYAGSSSGAVTRYRHADVNEKQFTVPGGGQPVRDIRFSESAPGAKDDAIVRIVYADGSELALDLSPKPPAIAMTDRNGRTIPDNAGWHAGPAAVKVTGSGHRLPANTVFEGANNDFRDGYLAGYEYRILRYRSGAWKPVSDWMPANQPVQIDQVGADIRLEARAATTSVSGLEDAKTYGQIAVRTVSLDDSGPAVTVKVDDEGNPVNTDPIIRITASDSESPVKRVLAEMDGRTKSFGGGSGSVQISMRLSELIPDENARIGWWKLVATAENEAGLKGTGSAVFVVNPGPDGKLASQVDGKTVDASGKAVNKPVTVLLTNYKEIIVARRPDIPESRDIRLSEASYQVVPKGGAPSANAWKKFGGLKLQVTREGAHTVWVKLTDSEGNEKLLSLDVNINYNQKRY